MSISAPTKLILIRLLKTAWIAIQLALILVFMQRGSFFFYQGF
ncbi:MAG TPA: hypothetical protein VMF30_13280 [Pirellulales bacterium]|nr:hypothetical protein [Pirellulales bacterium]